MYLNKKNTFIYYEKNSALILSVSMLFMEVTLENVYEVHAYSIYSFCMSLSRSN